MKKYEVLVLVVSSVVVMVTLLIVGLQVSPLGDAVAVAVMTAAAIVTTICLARLLLKPPKH